DGIRDRNVTGVQTCALPILLSKSRSYSPCPDCAGARLKPDAALWRVGAQPAPQADHPLFMPVNAGFSTTTLARLPGLNIVDLMQIGRASCREGVSGERRWCA